MSHPLAALGTMSSVILAVLVTSIPASRAEVDPMYQGFTPSYYNQSPNNAPVYDDWGNPGANPFTNNAPGYAPPAYNYSFGGGGGRRSGGPMISMNLNAQESLNSDFRIAARENRVPDVRKMLERGAAINSASESGETALMYAARFCWPKVSSLLIESKADVNLRNKLGKTALMFAATGSCQPVVKQLLRAPGIRIETTDLLRKTAADYARDAALMEVGGPSEEIVRLIDASHARHRHAQAHARKSPPG